MSIDPNDLVRDQDTDAKHWAESWVGIAQDILIRHDWDPHALLDEGWMIGWFANAIEVGRDVWRLADQREETK
jgi:hypothetical protein